MALPVAKFTACPRYCPFKGFGPLKAWGLENFRGGQKIKKKSKFLKNEGDSKEMSPDIK